MLLQYQIHKIYPALSIIVITLPLICSIRIIDNAATTSSTQLPPAPIASTYRISVPRPQRPSNRVPPHLQDVRNGYVDDDADDVIHIIEPPSYFQQLKRQAHRQQAFQVAQPQLTIDTAKKSSSSSSSSMDLLTQETQNTAIQQKQRKFATILPMQMVKLQQRQQQQQPQNAVPFELLASVRHKDRFFHRSRPLTLPFARERLKVKNIQTFLMEQGFEQQQHERGQQLSYGGLQRRASGQQFGVRSSKRVRRDVDSSMKGHLEYKSADTASNISTQNGYNSNYNTTERKTKGIQLPNGYLRRKRDVPENNRRIRKIKRSNRNKVGIKEKTSTTKESNSTKRKAELLQKYALLKGNDLIEHITELLHNATQYTSDGLKLINNNKITVTTTKTLSQLRQQFQHDNRPAELIGEIEPTVGGADNKLKEEQINKILEQSVNTTDAIMMALLNYTKLTAAQCPRDTCDSNNIEPNKRIQHLQSRIDCIRQHMSNQTTPATTTTQATTITVTRHRRKQTPTTKLPTTLLRANLQDQPDNELSAAAAASNISTTLLYDDIMTNIRNLLQAKNLEELNEEFYDSKKQPDFISELPIRSIEDAAANTDFGEFKHLNEYLNELQRIVSDFIVTPSNAGDSTTEMTLNSREYKSSIETTTQSLNNWFIINNDGQIYQTNLSAELHPTVAVFHRFPDIPKTEIYLRNKTKAYEIL